MFSTMNFDDLALAASLGSLDSPGVLTTTDPLGVLVILEGLLLIVAENSLIFIQYSLCLLFSITALEVDGIGNF